MDRKNYLKLQQKREELVSKMQSLLGGENPTAEDIAQADQILKGDLAAVDSQLATYAEAFARELTMPAVATVSVTDRSEADPMRGFHSAADFARAVHSACYPGSIAEPRLQALRRAGEPMAAPTGYMQEGQSAEGYLVPPAISSRVWELVSTLEDIFQLCSPEPTASNAVGLQANETTPWGATGVQAYWRAEAAQMTASKIVPGERQTRLHELYALVLATEELISDAPLLESRLTRDAAKAISWKASEAVVRGTGAGQPLGFEKAACLVTVAKESSQAADTILPKNLTKMFSRLLASPGDVVRWLANRDVVSEFVDLKIGNEPSWVGINGGLRDAPNGMLLGYPILFTEHAKTLGDLGDITLANFSGYHAVERRGGVKYDTSIHLYFDYAMTAFRWIFRLGGQPYLSGPVSPANGSNTRSHFVNLAERA